MINTNAPADYAAGTYAMEMTATSSTSTTLTCSFDVVMTDPCPGFESAFVLPSTPYFSAMTAAYSDAWSAPYTYSDLIVNSNTIVNCGEYKTYFYMITPDSSVPRGIASTNIFIDGQNNNIRFDTSTPPTIGDIGTY